MSLLRGRRRVLNNFSGVWVGIYMYVFAGTILSVASWWYILFVWKGKLYTGKVITNLASEDHVRTAPNYHIYQRSSNCHPSQSCCHQNYHYSQLLENKQWFLGNRQWWNGEWDWRWKSTLIESSLVKTKSLGGMERFLIGVLPFVCRARENKELIIVCKGVGS
jgi:hypothetical protein